jgi:multidrug resistance efflux pump
VVRSVTAHLGQEVKAGDLLATIDSPIVGDARLELYTRLQTLEIAAAQADWQATIYTNTLELIDLLEKKESSQRIQELFRGKPVGENRERLLTAYAQYRLAEVTLARNRDLYAQSLITAKQIQQVSAEYDVAQATYVVAVGDELCVREEQGVRPQARCQDVGVGLGEFQGPGSQAQVLSDQPLDCLV